MKGGRPMPHWTSMTIKQMVNEFRNLFSTAELWEELAASEKAIADHEGMAALRKQSAASDAALVAEYERIIGLHRRRWTAIMKVLKEHESDGNAG